MKVLEKNILQDISAAQCTLDQYACAYYGILYSTEAYSLLLIHSILHCDIIP